MSALLPQMKECRADAGTERARRGNAFNPTFRSHTSAVSQTSSASLFTFNFQSHPSPGMLDLVFLRFEVLNAKGNLKAAAEEGKGDSVGAYTIALGALMPGQSILRDVFDPRQHELTSSYGPGYRHIPLYDSMGDQHLFSTLFLRSRIDPSFP